MTLFLILAVPAFSVALFRWQRPEALVWGSLSTWIPAAVVTLASVIVQTIFIGARVFDGDWLGAAIAFFWTDGVLIPGLAVGLWLLARRKKSTTELMLWVALLFTVIGLRDALVYRPSYDLTELLLVPINRMMLVLWIPMIVAIFFQRPLGTRLAIAIAGAVGLLFSSMLTILLSFAHWGWFVGIVNLGLIVWGVFLFQKREASPTKSKLAPSLPPDGY